jgi:VWFA-related protein
MREAAQDIRSRLFVLFLDTGHVDWGASLNVRSPLIQGLNQMIGGDDLVAVMTPGMESRDLTFSRRTTAIEQLLKTAWGQRDVRVHRDPEETDFELCYPGEASKELIQRYREVRTLDSLEELVQRLRFIREERKAVIAITQGWRLFNDDPTLRRSFGNPVTPPVAPIGIDRRVNRPYAELFQKCEQTRISLSMLQNEARFHTILRLANTGNTSFYPVDPRGLVVFDEPIDAKVPIIEDDRRLKQRHESMRQMALMTDGIAVVQTGNLSAAMQRIVQDVSSYYLIGYYSTTEMDGRFHELTVRVKRPGVRVRARTGYLASTRADHAKALAAAAAGGAVKPMDLQTKEVQQSLSALAIFSRERPLRMQTAAAHLASGGARVYGVAEVPATSTRHDWSDGGQADVSLVDGRGQAVATESLTIPPGARSVRFSLGSTIALEPGVYHLRIRAKGTSATLAATESVRITLPAAPQSSGALLIRRGITTGNQPMPTADLRFRRTERITVEVPTQSRDAGTAQLLDRSGKPIPMPVAAGIRDDGDGSRWRTAQLTLGPLAPGDYIVEQSAGADKTLTAIRVLP